MEQQQQQQENNEDNFIDRFLAKFGFRNEQNNHQHEVNMSNSSIDINYNINDDTKDKLTTAEELNMNGEKDKEMETTKQKECVNNISNDQKEEEIKGQKTDSHINLDNKLKKKLTHDDIEFLSRQLEALIHYLYRLPNFNYIRKEETKLNKYLEELEYFYKEIEFTKKAFYRIKNTKCAVRKEKLLMKNNLEHLRSSIITTIENIVSAHDAELSKKWEELKKSENVAELNNFLNDIKSKEMALDTMSRLVRRRIFQVETSSAILDKDSISSIKSQKSNEFTIGPTLTQTVSTSPLNSHTSSKRNSVATTLRRRRLISNASSSGIKLRPFIDRENILSLPSTSSNTIQGTNRHSSNNSMFVSVSNSSDSSAGPIGPQLPFKSRITRQKQSSSLLRTRRPPIPSIFDNDVLILSQNSSTSETSSGFSCFTSSSNFQTDVKSVLKRIFGKDAREIILQEDETYEEDDEEDNANQNIQESNSYTNIPRRNLTIHEIEFEALQRDSNQNGNESNNS